MRLPLFAGMGPRDLELMESVLRRRPLTFNEPLFTEGDAARSCYVLVNGEINVLKRMNDGKSQHLATLRPGALVGHVALIDHRPRSATCVATGRALVLELSGDDFDRLFDANSPFAFKILDAVATDLVARLRTATERLTQAATDTTPEKRRISVREAAEALLAGKSAEFAGEDLDGITFSINENTRRDYKR